MLVIKHLKVLILVLILSLVTSDSVVSAQEVGDNIEHLLLGANESYNKGAYQEAVSVYEQLLNAGLHNGHIYYNLANAYYRQGNIGKAVYNYRRALFLLPTDPDIKANLNLARKQTKDNLWAEESNSGITKLVLANYFTPRELYWMFIISYVGFWALIFIQYHKQSPMLKLFLPIYTASLLWISASYFGTAPSWDGSYSFAFSIDSTTKRPAVVLAEELNVNSGDSDRYQVVFVLHQGAEILATEQRANWIHILLPDGKQGWAPSSHLGLL